MGERENRRGRDWAWGKYLPDAEEEGVSVGGGAGEDATGRIPGSFWFGHVGTGDTCAKVRGEPCKGVCGQLGYEFEFGHVASQWNCPRDGMNLRLKG